jgi:serine phosphatase RsbU (regulator of sigma subunit)
MEKGRVCSMASQRTTPLPPGKPRYRILIADDSSAVRSAFAEFLKTIERAEFELVEAHNGVEALKTLGASTRPFDLVVTDLTMPEMDGLALVRHLRNQEAFRSLPILFLTAHTEEEKRIEVFRVGATDYVVKPFLAAELEARIMGHLERRRAFETILGHERAVRQSLEQARLTQAALLPQAMPVLPGATLAVRYEPTEALGGDFYDFYPLEGGRLGLMLADVSGHGVAAALVSFLLAGIFRHNVPTTTDPEAALARSQTLLRGKIPESRYATAHYAVFDPARRHLTYSSAGYPAPILIRPAENDAHQLSLDGSPLGLVEAERVRLHRAEVALAPGDRVLFHSDALLEGGGDGQVLGFTRLRRFLLEHAALAPQALLDAVYDFGLATCQRNRYADDVTLVLLTLDAAGAEPT